MANSRIILITLFICSVFCVGLYFSSAYAQAEGHQLRCSLTISPDEPYQGGSAIVSFIVENIGNTTFNGKVGLSIVPAGTSLAAYSEIQLNDFTRGRVQNSTQSFQLFFDGMYSAILTITPNASDISTPIKLYVGSSLLDSNTYTKQFYVMTLDTHIQLLNTEIQRQIANSTTTATFAAAISASFAGISAVVAYFSYKNGDKSKEVSIAEIPKSPENTIPNKSEEREFQLEMLKIQLDSDVLGSIITILISIMVAVIAVILTLVASLSEVLPYTSLLPIIYFPIGATLISGIVFWAIVVSLRNRRIEGLRKNFIEKESAKTPQETKA